ncbi:unnamed protein product [Arabidopsis thaliana]|uniref:Uncharacterized protein n=2 Tax=Arabidopsis thaliana TaxID=3702 RepID=A0A654GE80_ARATH|nr:uncharacterized protein AT5G65225 [Arabidopsis thaliana]ANM68768.1 hypothetical protein AT5G65225 [Arabidopsis thaliana]VYS71469.1 unnamed protein product [Arabidopsis thaliana]|eukprot:NP_001330490.1 hypothetical protein AT5G65225 [Arabidopsis thaliana]
MRYFGFSFCLLLDACEDYFGWFLPPCAFSASWIFYGDVLVRLYGLVLRNLRCYVTQSNWLILVVTTKRRAINDYHWFDRYNVIHCSGSPSGLRATQYVSLSSTKFDSDLLDFKNLAISPELDACSSHLQRIGKRKPYDLLYGKDTEEKDKKCHLVQCRGSGEKVLKWIQNATRLVLTYPDNNALCCSFLVKVLCWPSSPPPKPFCRNFGIFSLAGNATVSSDMNP